MNYPDFISLYVMYSLNSYMNVYPFFDRLMSFIAGISLLKGAFILALYYWVWFKEKESTNTREFIIASLFASSISGLMSRGLAVALPFVERPFNNAALDFTTVQGKSPFLLGWSSFPSDHAAFFFALATGLFLVSRLFGTIAFLHAVFVISFPRIYLGAHFLGDIIGGAILGVGIVCIFSLIPFFRKGCAYLPLLWHQTHPPSFYAFIFLLAFELATNFDDIVTILSISYKIFFNWLN